MVSLSTEIGISSAYVIDCSELGQIIRASVNGTNEVLVYESDIFYVLPSFIKLMSA